MNRLEIGKNTIFEYSFTRLCSIIVTDYLPTVYVHVNLSNRRVVSFIHRSVKMETNKESKNSLFLFK